METSKTLRTAAIIKLSNGLEYSTSGFSYIDVYRVYDDSFVIRYTDMEIFFGNAYGDILNMEEGNVDVDEEMYFTIDDQDARYRFNGHCAECFEAHAIDAFEYLAKLRKWYNDSYGVSEKSPNLYINEDNAAWKVTIEEIAADSDALGVECQEIAEAILRTPGMKKVFYDYRNAFLETNARLTDLADMIAGLPYRFKNTALKIKESGLYRLFFGNSREERLNACFQYMMEDVSARDRFDHAEIQDGGYKYDGATFTWLGHYCFAKGRISFDEMLNGLRDFKKSA
ncbi:hypothetical protein [Bacteroides sp.]|uniref:hypothetical protein n=1 Tax=Bacteroides sp. TaxID=29523 RepID=UPI002614E953|nr:hypothetical protein [Bacteroides sp.]MDD3040904.1 hypothetical protein [Bacteroides sp.]